VFTEFSTLLPSLSVVHRGLQVLGFLLLVAVVAIVTPVYHFFTTGSASSTEIGIAVFVLGLIILFFAAPVVHGSGGTALLATVFFYAAFNPDPLPLVMNW